MVFVRKGMGLVYDDKINSFSKVSINEQFDKLLEKNKVSKTRNELNTRKIPVRWTIDFNTLTGNCDFEQTDNGYRISSPDGFLSILAPARAVLNTVTGISLELSCNTDESQVKVGIEEYGMIRRGKHYVTEISGIHKEEFINFEISALEHYESIRPLLEIKGDVTIHRLRIYQKGIKGLTLLEGQILERSVLPDPKESDYPNCRFTIHFEGAVIKDGEPVPKEIALIAEGFENYKLLGTDRLKQGDKVLCAVIPFENLSEEQQSTQQADDLNLFLLNSFYVANIKTISEYSDDPVMPKSGLYFWDDDAEYVSVFERHINPPIPQSLINAQNMAIQEDLQKMNKLLADYDDNKIQEVNERFLTAWEKEKKKDPEGYNRPGYYVWRNIDNSFWCLPNGYNMLLAEPALLTQESLDSFSALKKACEANGVQFIVSLVPDMYVIAARVINKDFRDIPDIQTATFVKQLSEIGIETIYPSDAIIQNYNRYPFAFFFPNNDHPSDTTQDIIADILSERLKRYEIPSELDLDLFSIKQSPHVYKSYGESENEKYLFPENCDIGDNQPRTSYTCREVLYNGKQIPLSKDASILVIGNSFMQTPMLFPETVPTLISYKLKIPVDWYRRNAYGPFSDIIVQFLTQSDSFLKGKKVIIFYVGTRHLRTLESNGNFLNISVLDNDRIVLNNKKRITQFAPASNTGNPVFLDPNKWGNLATMDKSCFIVRENNELICSLKLDQKPDFIVDESKPITLIIPAACPRNNSCNLRINDQAKTVPFFYTASDSKFCNLAFELPAGTKEVDVKVEGEPGSMFVIKDIQIWQ